MSGAFEITGYDTRSLRIPERPVGDSQTHVFETDQFDYQYVEIGTTAGVTGIGIDLVELRAPGHPSRETLESRVDAILGEVVGENPMTVLNRQDRYRGGAHDYYSSGSYGSGVGVLLDMALWDACAKYFEQPLDEFMGGTRDAVPVYASGLSFINDDRRTREVYERFAELGEFEAAKVKVGHPSIDADVDRLQLVDDAMGSIDHLMIDPNEAWSPKETTRRIRAFRDVGFDVFWVEDPVFRHDIDGLQRVVENTPRTHVTIGEYQGFEEKGRLLGEAGCDVLNLQGLSAARRGATLAQSTGTKVAMSTDHTTDAMAVHAGLSLPDVLYVECTYPRLLELVEDPFVVEDGDVRSTDRPGHGVELPDDVLERYAR